MNGFDGRVLIVPPTRRDGDITARVLDEAGLRSRVCAASELAAEIHRGAAAVVLTDDVLDPSYVSGLWRELQAQPDWSDLSFVVLARGGMASVVLDQLQTVASVTLLERSVHIRTLVSAVQMAVRARKRQYQLRDLLASERQARVDADRANQAKDRFLAILSHELRTPLTPIVYAVSSLQHAISSDGPQRRAIDATLPRALEMIRRNIALETKLIDDLLDLNRVVRGKLQLQTAIVDMHAKVNDTLLMVENDARGKGVALAATLTAERHHLNADGARMHQVLWNLVKNAIKFTPGGGRIDVKSWNDADAFLLSCCDTGIGIPADALSRIFAPFEQGSDDTTRRFGGLGLGLAISRSLVEAHGGTIAAASLGRGRGAAFTIRLPGAIAAPAEAHPRGRGNGTGRRRQLRILLVEDHDDTSRALRDALSASGHTVNVEHDVAAALRTARAQPHDLLISDIGLPDGSGVDLVKQITRPRCGAIAISGFGMDDDVRRSLAAGFDRHLTKPIDYDQLDQVISELARSANVQRPNGSRGG